ncbi:MAG: exodeoxyribonuclease VII small subunit [Synergistaceae bacterium]|jgi:exodeoxyribonuclease VII small subunit|nr:exodeoxyribonuclease VII small subunit [Synergistaceae bacterium]
MNFGENLEHLDEILKRLEEGKLSLDESLEVFEKGILLIRESRDFLALAEQKATILTRDGEEIPFDRDEEGREKESNLT